MSAVPALRKGREERGTPDRGKTNKLKVGPPVVDKSQSIEKPHFSPRTREMGHPRVLNQGKRAVHGVEDVGHPPALGLFQQKRNPCGDRGWVQGK
jgi:hypothetical protein